MSDKKRPPHVVHEGSIVTGFFLCPVCYPNGRQKGAAVGLGYNASVEALRQGAPARCYRCGYTWPANCDPIKPISDAFYGYYEYSCVAIRLDSFCQRWYKL